MKANRVLRHEPLEKISVSDSAMKPGDVPLLPNLIYIGDVPIEATHHGSALLYRLFSTFPAEKLFVVEANAWTSSTQRRLQRVRYASINIGSARVLNSRLSKFYLSYVARGAAGRARRIGPLLQGFMPQGVVTVAHGTSWITAAKWAEASRLPLHLIVHDDWLSCIGLSSRLESWLQAKFASIYRQSETRWCVSSYMRSYYEEQLGVRGEILLPTRAHDTIVFTEPKARSTCTDPGFTVAYGGAITVPGYAEAIRMLADSLQRVRGRVLLFSPLSGDSLPTLGLNLPNVELRGMRPSSEFIVQAREEADALFVPMSFEESQRKNMQVSFPSKFTDYTCIGLPIIVHGPEYCSAVRFAREYEGFALVSTSKDQAALNSIIETLAGSVELRFTLGKRAIRVGEVSFSIASAARLFYDTLSLPHHGAVSG